MSRRLLLAFLALAACDGTSATPEPLTCARADDCPAGDVCIALACAAATPCTSSRTCAGLVCSTTLAVCVECNADMDCASGSTCVSHVCAPVGAPCRSDVDCSVHGLVCARDLSQCVECVASADCASGLACSAAHTCVAGDLDAGTSDAPSSDAYVPVDAGPHAPTPAWAIDLTSSELIVLYRTRTDGGGTTYLLGELRGTTDFGGGPVTSGPDNIFLATLDERGALGWVHLLSPTGNALGNDLAVDSLGNAYVAGQFEGSVDLGGGTITSIGAVDALVASFDAAGHFRWARHWGGDATTNTSFVEVALDDAGRPVLAGSFTGTLVVGGTSYVSGTAGATLLVSLDADGNERWTHAFAAGYYTQPSAIDVGDAGSVVLTGNYQTMPPGTPGPDFGGGALTSPELGPSFIVSFDAAGVHRWSRVLAQGTTPMYAAQAFGVSSRGGTVTVVGTFGQPLTAAHVGSMQLGGSAPTLDGAGDLDAFVATFDEATGVAVDARAIASSGQEQGATIVEDAHGVVIGGSTSAAATLSLGAGVVSHGGAWVVSYGDGLTTRWAWTSAPAFSTDVAPLSGDRYVIGGMFRGMIDLGDGHVFTSGTGQDAFVLMLAP